MIRYNGRVQGIDGVVVDGALISVRSFLTGAFADIFENDGTTPKANPFTSDAEGLYSFTIDAGLYNLTLLKDGISDEVTELTLIDDPSIIYMVNDGAALIYGDLAYVYGDGLVRRATSAGTETEASAVGVCMEVSLANGATGRFRTLGVVRRTGTPGAVGYLKGAGLISEVFPTQNDGDVYSLVVGRQIRTSEFLLSPTLSKTTPFAPPAYPIITNALTYNAPNAVPFSFFITASGTAPITFSATGLPAWASLNTVTGEITGTPNAVANTSVSITATNAYGFDTETLVISIGVVPVINSALTAAATVGAPFAYTITCSVGTAPITFSATGLPAWASLNTSTGEITGTPNAAAVTNVSITATNAYGFDTETLVITAAAAIADLSAVRVNNSVWRVCHIGARVYITGDFSTVTDASGTYARPNGTACLDVSTGLWQSWSPSITGGSSPERRLYADPSGLYVYIFGAFSAINGVAATGARRVDPITGATDAGWTPSSDSGCTGLVRQGGLVYMFGAFTLSGAARFGYGAVSAIDGTSDAWRPLDQLSNPPIGSSFSGAGGAFIAGGNIWYGIRFHGTVAQGFGSASPSSGVAVPLTDGIGLTSSNNVRRLAVASNRVCIVGNWSAPSGAVSNNLTGAPTIANSTYIAMFTTGGVFVGLTALDAEGVMEDVAPHGSDDFFVAGSFSDVAGDSSYAGIARINGSGALVPGFHPLWGLAPNIRGVEIAEDDYVIAVGDFNTTLNGTPRQGIVVMNAATGAPY